MYSEASQLLYYNAYSSVTFGWCTEISFCMVSDMISKPAKNGLHRYICSPPLVCAYSHQSFRLVAHSSADKFVILVILL